MLNISERLRDASQIVVPKIASASAGGGSYSVSIVNSNNGKRISISKALAQELGLSDKAQLQPCDETSLLLGADLGIPQTLNCNLRGDNEGKKIAYCSDVVVALCAFFQLDYSGGKTSRAFTQIDIETTDDGKKIAIITMK